MGEFQSLATVSSGVRTQPDRRTFGWRTVWYATLYRRRSRPRRAQDASLLHADTLPLASSLLVLMIVSLSLLDAFFTTLLLSRGAVEVNPFMNLLIQTDSSLFAFIKIKLTGICVIALVVMANQRLFGRWEALQIARLVMAGYLYLIAWELFLLG